MPDDPAAGPAAADACVVLVKCHSRVIDVGKWRPSGTGEGDANAVCVG